MYFHFLDSGVIGGVRVEECEVNEKPKSYTASTNFPEGYTNRMVRKTKIGVVIGRFNPVVVQYKQDEDCVRTIFKRRVIEKMNVLDDEEARLKKLYEVLNQK